MIIVKTNYIQFRFRCVGFNSIFVIRKQTSDVKTISGVIHTYSVIYNLLWLIAYLSNKWLIIAGENNNIYGFSTNPIAVYNLYCHSDRRQTLLGW